MLCDINGLLGVILSDHIETDEFVRQQIEAEWRRKVKEEIDEIRACALRAEPHHKMRPLDVLPSVISGLTVIAAVIGMIWSFMLNQQTFQAVNTQKLDNLSDTLREIRKNADQVPLIALQLQAIDTRQKTAEEQAKKDEQRLSDVTEALARMGVRPAK